jgi:hypothetical protein
MRQRPLPYLCRLADGLPLIVRRLLPLLLSFANNRK